MYLIQFDCPFCSTPIKVQADELAPGKFVKCQCEQLIPAEVIYDESARGKKNTGG